MPSVLNAKHRAELCTQVGSLSESSTRRWGTLTTTGMLSHLCRACEMALGELPVRPGRKRAFEVFPLKHLMLYVLPLPKGVPTAPELLHEDHSSVAAGRTSLQVLLERIGSGQSDGMGPTHPLFGRLSWREWGSLVYKHVDHHLRQFGV